MTEERFIKLTQRDNRSIWLNARFIVTIEPNKDGGALVVPMGDGMDYEVRESAETVVSLCAGEVVAAPKPGDAQRKQQQQQKQPQQQGAQKQPNQPAALQQQGAQRQPTAEGEKAGAETVVPDERKPVETAAEPDVSEAKPAEVVEAAGATSAPAAVAEPAPAIAVSQVPAEEAPAAAEAPAKPAKKTRARTAKSKKSAAASASPAAASAAPETDAKPAEENAAEEKAAVPERPAASEKPAQAARKPGGAQSDDEVLAKAAKLGCRSRTRLMNTLKSQFGKTEDAAAALVADWAEKGELSIDGNGHVEWKNRKGVAE